MHRRPLVAVALLALAATGSACNGHPVKPVETLTSAVCDEDSSVPVVQPKVMLVLDRSGSMTDESWDHDRDSSTPEVTRWSSLHGVVTQLVDRHDARLDLGATMFPAATASRDSWAFACVAPEAPDVAVGAQRGASILAAMPNADATLEGATPATASYLAALDHLADIEGDDPRVLVLVTDGVANCGDGSNIPARYDEALQDAVAHAHEDLGIVTYVVGIDISSDFDDAAQVVPHDALDAVARVGGVSRDGDAAYYDVFDQVELAAALDEIAADLGCSLSIDGAAEDRDLLVSIDGATRDQLDTCDGQDASDGWAWIPGEEGRQLELCGQACGDYQRTGDAVVNYDCSL